MPTEESPGISYNVSLYASNPIIQAIRDIEEIHKKKARDYARDNNPFSNFQEAAVHADISSLDVVEVMIGIKDARIRNLRSKPTKTIQNESLLDSYLDRAVYSIIAYAMMKEQNRGELPF